MIDTILSSLYQLFPEVYMLSRYLDRASNVNLVIYSLAIIGGITTLNWTIRKIV